MALEARTWWWDRSNYKWNLLCAFWRMDKPTVLVSLARQIGGGRVSAEVQRFLLSECIYGQVSDKFSPDVAYSTRVIKAFVEAIEEEVRRSENLLAESPLESCPKGFKLLPEAQQPSRSEIHVTEGEGRVSDCGLTDDTREARFKQMEEPDAGAISEGGRAEDEEGVTEELCDALCTFLTSSTLSKKNSCGWCHRSYAYSPPGHQLAELMEDCTPEGQLVSLRLAHNLLQGSTGCHIWPASFVLCQVVLSHQWLVAGRACLEVGSGSGLLATCLARLRPAKVICTDGDDETLENLALNLAANGISVSRYDWHVSSTEKGTPQVSCHLLPWEGVTGSDVEVMDPDILFGADVVYDPSVIPALVNLIALFLHPRRMPPENSVSSHPVSYEDGVEMGECDSCSKWLLRNSSDGKDGRDTSWSLSSFRHAVSKCMKLARGLNARGGRCCIQTAIMATAVRNESTLKVFETEALAAGLVIKDLAHAYESEPTWFHGHAEIVSEKVRVLCLFREARFRRHG